MDKEKVYLTRDEDDKIVWVWRKPKSSSTVWQPIRLKGCEIVVFVRDNKSLENTDSYLLSDFKKKFGITISPKTKKSVKLPKKLLHSEDYKLISSDPDRKQ